MNRPTHAPSTRHPEPADRHPGTTATLRDMIRRSFLHLGVAGLCLLGAMTATALVGTATGGDDALGVLGCVVLFSGAVTASVAFILSLARTNRVGAVLHEHPWTPRHARLEPGQAAVRDARAQVLALRIHADDGPGPPLYVTPVSPHRPDLVACLDEEDVWYAGGADGLGVVAPRGGAHLVLVRTVRSADPETEAAAAALADRTQDVTWSALPGQAVLRRALGHQAARRLTDTAIPIYLPEDETAERIRLTDLTMVDGEIRAVGLRVGTPGPDGRWTRVLVERPASTGAAPVPGVHVDIPVDGRPERFVHLSNGRSEVAVGFAGRWQLKVFTRNRSVRGIRLVGGGPPTDARGPAHPAAPPTTHPRPGHPAALPGIHD